MINKYKYEVNMLPIDPLMFGDNRSARAGMDHHRNDQDPSPITLFGAVGESILNRCGRTWPHPQLGEIIKDLKDNSDGSAELLGYVLMDRDGKLWFPKPGYFRLGKIAGSSNNNIKAIDYIRPIEIDSNIKASSCDYKHLLYSEPISNEYDEVDKSLLISEVLLEDVLVFNSNRINRTLNKIDYKEASSFWVKEERVGVGIDNDTYRNKKGILFSQNYRRFTAPDFSHDRVKLNGYKLWYGLCKVLEDKDTKSDIEFVGGDRRRAFLEFKANEKPLENIKTKVLNAVEKSNGFLAYCLTPYIYEGKYPLIETIKPDAACYSKPQVISGWDVIKKQPRPTLAVIPAGSVFFYEWPGNISIDNKKALIDNNWLKSINTQYVNAGFGRIILGVW